MKFFIKFIDFIFYKVKEPLKKWLTNIEMSVLIYYFPFLGNWFLKGALKMLLTKTNNAAINAVLIELHYVANVEQGKITLKRIEDAKNSDEWTDAINSGMQSSDSGRSNRINLR